MDADMDDIIATKEAAKDAWLGRPGVTGMDVGLKYVGGKRTADVAIRLFVSKKLADVSPEERFPTALGKHKTDVIEREFKPVGLPDGAAYDPLLGGIQLWGGPWAPGWASGPASTAGMLVRDNLTGQQMILGTFHGSRAPNSPVYQPISGAQIGYVARNGRNLTPATDADLMLVDTTRETACDILELSVVKGVKAVGVADLGVLKVKKRGHYTGVTHGTLEGVAGSHTTKTSHDYAAPYNYPDYKGNIITYHHMLSFAVDADTAPVYRDPQTNEALFVHGGDSGSVVLDSDNNAIALLVWGDKGGSDGEGGAVGGGPPIPLILAQLNVTPCIEGGPRSVVLSSEESPTNPKVDEDGNTGDWGKSESGTANLKAWPTCPVKPYNWTFKNTFQRVTFRATVEGFNQPVFSWKLNGHALNDFANDGNASVTVWAMVELDNPNNPDQITRILQPVTLKFVAYHVAINKLGRTFAELSIWPTEVQGHIFLTGHVDVRDKNATAPGSVFSQSAFAKLDTQELEYESAYKHDRLACQSEKWRRMQTVRIRHPYTVLNFLLDQPYPPPAVVTGIRFLSQLGLELDELSQEHSELAQELSGIFATTLNVPSEWLLGRGVGKR